MFSPETMEVEAPQKITQKRHLKSDRSLAKVAKHATNGPLSRFQRSLTASRLPLLRSRLTGSFDAALAILGIKMAVRGSARTTTLLTHQKR
jgi:hypothetical protein